jgi:hypothetical protein
MHIMINGNYLSLDNILFISKIEDLRPAHQAKSFYIHYLIGNKTIEFYQSEACPLDGEMKYSNFYFKNESVLTETYNRIIEILTNNAA